MKKFFSSSTIKLIAVSSMLIDHMAMCLPVFSENPMVYSVMRQIGRLAFPIFCFCIAEGYFHTSNVKRYMLRLFLFALISEAPFDLARGADINVCFGHQNVFFTLCLGLITIYMVDNMRGVAAFQICVVAASCLLAYALRFDYTMYGIAQMLVFYYFRFRRVPRIAGVAAVNVLLGQPLGTAALIFTELYNGKRGLRLKYALYAFYPVHLMVLYLIRAL